MRNYMPIGLAIAFAVISAGCTKSADSGGAASADSIKQAIKADEAKWNEQIKAKDTEGLAGHYTDDAYFVAPGAAPADGSTAIRQFYANGLTDPALEVEIASDRIDVGGSGDMAYSRGHYTEKYTDKKTNKVMTDKGSYLSVYKKQADGSWKMVEDFATADPDSVKPVEPGKAVTHAKMVSGV